MFDFLKPKDVPDDLGGWFHAIGKSALIVITIFVAPVIPWMVLEGYADWQAGRLADRVIGQSITSLSKEFYIGPGDAGGNERVLEIPNILLTSDRTLAITVKHDIVTDATVVVSEFGPD